MFGVILLWIPFSPFIQSDFVWGCHPFLPDLGPVYISRLLRALLNSVEGICFALLPPDRWDSPLPLVMLIRFATLMFLSPSTYVQSSRSLYS